MLRSNREAAASTCNFGQAKASSPKRSLIGGHYSVGESTFLISPKRLREIKMVLNLHYLLGITVTIAIHLDTATNLYKS